MNQQRERAAGSGSEPLHIKWIGSLGMSTNLGTYKMNYCIFHSLSDSLKLAANYQPASKAPTRQEVLHATPSLLQLAARPAGSLGRIEL